jgi:hypothetical protein
VLKSSTRTLENNGQEKVDLKLKYSKKEKVRLQTITENMIGKFVDASRSIISLKKSGVSFLKRSKKNLNSSKDCSRN